MGGWRKFHIYELRGFYCSPKYHQANEAENVIDGACSTHGRQKEWLQFLWLENLKEEKTTQKTYGQMQDEY